MHVHISSIPAADATANRSRTAQLSSTTTHPTIQSIQVPSLTQPASQSRNMQPIALLLLLVQAVVWCQTNTIQTFLNRIRVPHTHTSHCTQGMRKAHHCFSAASLFNARSRSATVLHVQRLECTIPGLWGHQVHLLPHLAFMYFYDAARSIPISVRWQPQTHVSSNPMRRLCETDASRVRHRRCSSLPRFVDTTGSCGCGGGFQLRT